MRSVLASLLLVLCLSVSAQAESPLDNAQVLQLIELGLGDEVVIAKIKQAGAVQFALETDDLIELKGKGASGPVIAAMLQRSTAAAPAAASTPAGAEVTLVAGGEEHALVPMNAQFRSESRVFAVVTYMDIDGMESSVAVKDARPSFVVRSETNPIGTYFIAWARPVPKHNKREVKSGTLSVGGAQSTSRPHQAWTMEYAAEALSPGLWKLTPNDDLGGGDFVLWKTQGATMGTYRALMFDFAIMGHPVRPWDQ